MFFTGRHIKTLHRLNPVVQICICTTDLDQRSQTSYTAMCNGIVSHGAPTGGIRVNHTHMETNAKKMCPWSSLICAYYSRCALRLFTDAYLSPSDHSRHRWRTLQTNQVNFDHVKNLNTINWSSMQGGKWHWFLNRQSQFVICTHNLLAANMNNYHRCTVMSLPAKKTQLL